MEKSSDRASNNDAIQRTADIVNGGNKSRPRSKRFKVLFLSGLIIVLLLGSLGWVFYNNRNFSVLEGPAPDFSLTGFEGETLTLSELRGQVVVINFWASWCIPCRTETPYLERVWREYQDKDVMFIGVDIQDTLKDAQAFLDEFDVTYFTGPDFGSEIARAYNVQGLPQTFIINKNGDIDAVFVGEVFPPELESKLDELLAQPGP